MIAAAVHDAGIEKVHKRAVPSLSGTRTIAEIMSAAPRSIISSVLRR